MAGAIIVNDENIIAMSTAQFDYFLERIEREFCNDDKFIWNEICAPVINGGMMFISATTQDSKGLAIFAKAIEEAKLRASVENAYEKYRALWEKLLNAINNDVRLQG